MTRSQRFHAWLELVARHLVDRFLGCEPEKFVLYVSASGLAERGIMIGSRFTDPNTYREYTCTRIIWEPLRGVTDNVAKVYGREVR